MGKWHAHIKDEMLVTLAHACLLVVTHVRLVEDVQLFSKYIFEYAPSFHFRHVRRN